MENLRVRRAGFAYRRRYENFLQRLASTWLKKKTDLFEPFFNAGLLPSVALLGDQTYLIMVTRNMLLTCRSC